MSIFSSIKKSRQSAKTHNAKLAEQKNIEERATPYRHVPTHAASDAIASAPPSWRQADKVRVVEQNRRRSAMAASGHHMNMPGIPRVGSSLSYVAYASDRTASPMGPPLPRAYSHTGVSNLQHQAMMYGVPQMAYSQPYSLKGKDATRWPIYETPDQDPGYGKDAQSVAESSSGSSSSRDNLEMKAAQSYVHASGVVETRSHKLLNKPRQKSDSFTEKYTSGNFRRSGHVLPLARDLKPRPSTRGFDSTSTSTSAAPSPCLSSAAESTPATAQSSATTGTALSPMLLPASSDLAVRRGLVETSPSNSAASFPVLRPSSTPSPRSTQGITSIIATSSSEFPFPSVTALKIDSSRTINSVGAVQSPSPPSSPAKEKERSSSRYTQFTELERVDSRSESSQHSLPRIDRSKTQLPLSCTPVANTFPEAVVATSDTEDGKNAKSRKPRKGGNKLVKKPRGVS